MRSIATRIFAFAIVAASTAALVAPSPAEARPGGGPVGHGSYGGYHGGGYGGGYHGGYRGGYRGGRYWGPGPFWGAVGVGIGLGAIAYGSSYYGAYYGGPYGNYYDYPDYVVTPGVAGYVAVDPAPVTTVVRSAPQPVPTVSRAPDPIFYPKNGQTTAKTETDRQDCNRWATTQQGAMADASIFQRATFACMEGRGYSVR